MDYLLGRYVNIFTFQHTALIIQLVSQCIQIRLSVAAMNHKQIQIGV